MNKWGNRHIVMHLFLVVKSTQEISHDDDDDDIQNWSQYCTQLTKIITMFLKQRKGNIQKVCLSYPQWFPLVVLFRRFFWNSRPPQPNCEIAKIWSSVNACRMMDSVCVRNFCKPVHRLHADSTRLSTITAIKVNMNVRLIYTAPQLPPQRSCRYR